MSSDRFYKISRFGYLMLSLSFLIAFSKLNINLPGGIPISGQSFAVLLIALFAGPWWSSITIIIYLLLGVVGIPVFSGQTAGLEVLFGNTSGYLFGFVIAAWIVGKLGILGWNKIWYLSIGATLIGTIIILICGVAYLTYLFDFNKALEWGLYPFVLGAIIKVIIGGLIPPLYFKMVQ